MAATFRDEYFIFYSHTRSFGASLFLLFEGQKSNVAIVLGTTLMANARQELKRAHHKITD